MSKSAIKINFEDGISFCAGRGEGDQVKFA
jgi:hypothetical protein